jgi:Holliday junction resolvase RusA-like endonuclease
MVNIILKGEPKSTSHIYKITCKGRFASMYMSREGKAIKESYQWQVKSQWKSKPIETDIAINIKLYFGTKRKSDWDNYNKLSMDSMSGILWKDDSQILKATVEKFYDKENPRIEIILSEYKQIER